jgi:hypothetical protein
MADNPTPQSEQRQIALRIDESKMGTTYANTIRTSTTRDEVVLDFGLNLPVQGPENQPAIQFNVGSRVIMNWSGAKRLAASLAQVVQQYEQQTGQVIDIGQGGNRGGPRLSQ